MSIQSDSVTGMAVGAVVADTYKVVRLIGKGGMGAVWEADHQRLPGKKVAIKVLNADISDDEEQLTRFRREAEIASRLGHPNIVAVNDFNTLPDGAPYLVLELLHGEGLDQRIARGPLPWDEAAHIARQIGSALAAAHDQGVVHRDLKPQNVFLCPTDVGGDLITVAKVLDFGISKIRGSQTIKTQEQTLLGTPQYMSPEQATGAHSQIDERTDLFALAAMVYEMLAGTPAFQGANVPEVLFKVVYEPVPPLGDAVRAAVPGAALDAIDRGLSKKPEDRFGDVATFIEALTGRALGTFRGSSKIPAAIATGTRDDKVATAETHHADVSARGTGRGRSPAGGGAATEPTLAAGSHNQPALPAPASVASKRSSVDPNLDLGLDATVASTGRGSPTPIPGPIAPGDAGPVSSGAGSRKTLAGIALAAVAAVAVGLLAFGGGSGDDARRRGRRTGAAGAASAPQKGSSAAPADDAPAPTGATAGRGNGTDVPAGDGTTAAAATDESAPGGAAQDAGEAAAAHGVDAIGDAPRAPDTRPRADADVAPMMVPPPDAERAADAETNADGETGTRRHRRRDRGSPRDGDGDDAGDSTDTDDAPPEVAAALADAMSSYRAGDFAAARLAAQRTIYERPSPMAYAIVTMSYCGLRDLGNARANFRKVGRWKRRVVRQCRKHGLDL